VSARPDRATPGAGRGGGGGDAGQVPPTRPGESIRRELAAIFVLYLLLAAIPLIMGISCGKAV
jgi:hypothetical protein